MTCCRHCTTSLSAGKGGAVLCKAQVVCCLERSYHCEDGHVTVQTDFLSYPATNMDKASIRSRSHGEDVSKLVDQSSEAALSEERRKSETDLAASQGLPPVKSTINTNDLRYVEREVSDHVSLGDTAHLITAPVEIGADSNSCHIHNCVRGKRPSAGLDPYDWQPFSVQVETSSESSMPTTPVLGNGKRHNSAVPEGGRRFAWLTEKRLVSALSAKQDYEV